MGTFMMTAARLFVFCCVLCIVQASNVLVSVPNLLRLDVEETIAIAATGDKETVSVFLQDFDRKNTFSHKNVEVESGHPKLIKVMVTHNDLPDINFSNSKENTYVFLVVTGRDFTNECKLLVSLRSGYTFIQTDKPIYTPHQTVNVRILPLNDQLLPKNEPVRLQIKNPQGIVAKQNIFEKPWETRFPTFSYNFPPHPKTGEWSVVAQYGHNFQLNSTVPFKVDKYVLPTFTVKIKVPNFILPGDSDIKIDALADYVYGKKVQGTAVFKFGVKDQLGNIVAFGSKAKILEDGEASIKFEMKEITDHYAIKGFPLESKLFVEANVIDTATGIHEKAISEESIFVNSPYIISFRRSLKDFKPGLVAVILADVVYANGKPAAEVPTSIEVVDCHGKPVEVSKPTYISDKNGHIRYDFETHLHSPNYTVTIKTKDMKYKENQQFEGRHVLVQYNSPDNSYVAITRTEGNKIYQVGERFSASVYSIPTGQISNVFYLVLSKGRILFVKHLSKNNMVERHLSFDITPEMSPSIRIVMYALYKNELVTDSIHVEIKPVCQPNSEVEIESKFKEPTPGSEGKIILSGKPGTSVGILAIDSAIYALRNKDRLTKDKLFQTLKNDDIGCGPGGGLNTLSVLSNAGVTIFGNFKNISNENNVPSCAERVRHKREIIDAMVNKHGIDDKKCCKLGTLPDKYNRICEERAKIVQNITNENNDGNCTAAFLYCCKQLAHSVKADTRGRGIGSDFDNLEPVEDIDREEKQASVRKDFRETWLFQDFEIGDNGKKEVFTNLPDSITTWVIQAVSVSKQSGMCVSDAKELVSFKYIFLHLNIPYSVVQNEQVEIQATVFNYKSNKVTVTIYMYGVEDLCTGVDAGERSEYKEITIDPYSSATVGFPVVPLKIKEYIIRVVALSREGHDVVEKKLRVVAKGVLFENNIPFVLDPTNLRNRKERDTITDTYTNFIDPSRNLQITTVTLKPNENRVHGTESCLISVVGNEIGPTVETILMAPENLVNKPVGCGEQTMMFMGPTVYTLQYLKTKGKVTPEFERKIYDFIREGYNRELTFRKDDGSYSAFQHRPSSIWLTAFVMKIFCQSSNFIFIDRSVIRTGIKWLIEQQNDDGSFIERNPMIHLDMMGGNNGVIPMTAFVLISLQHCNPELKELQLSKLNAKVYLENAISIINKPYAMSLVSYALALSSSKLTDTANEILRNMSIYDEGPNQRYWSSGSSSYDIETTAYALLTQIAIGDMQYSLPIINWLNTKRLAGGRFESTQDTVVALQALSRYAMVAQSSEIDLYCNITQSNSKKSTVMHFTNDNAEVLQELELEKVGGTVFFTTHGKGVGQLSVQLRYNVEQPPEKLCKFDITVNITEAKVDVKPAIVNKNIGKDFFEEIPVDLLRGLDIDDDHAEFRNDERINFDNIILNNADFGGINPRIKDQPNFMPHVPIQQMANEIGGEKGVDYVDRNRDIDYNNERNRDIDGDDWNRAFDQDDDDRNRAFDQDDDDRNRAFDQDDDDRNRAFDQDDRNRDIDFDYDNGVEENEDERDRAIKGKVQKANSKAMLQITICARYLSAKQTDMSIIDAGIFSGFKPEIEDLKKLVTDANGIVDRYEIAGRSVVFYLKHIPFDKPVCLKFRVIREFIVGVVQPAVIKVFDYYNPEETCTRFYRPDSNSPFLRKICEGSICQCAEGGCPREKPFKSIPQQVNEARDNVLIEACEKHDYVWMGIVKSTQKKDNFFHVSFKITKVLKAGAEKETDIEYTTKILLLQDSCTSFEFIDNQEYLIMGNDGERFEDKQTKDLTYRYLIDRSTIIHKWTLIRKAENKNLQKILNWLKTELETKGCQY